MIISDDKKIRDIQNEFHRKFPYLKIEFYSEHHEPGQGSPARTQLPPELTIGEVRRVHVDGELSVNGHLKVSTLESNFFDQYGLNVQVFRKSGNLWLQTIRTDHWTLTDQNIKGMQADHVSAPVIAETEFDPEESMENYAEYEDID